MGTIGHNLMLWANNAEASALWIIAPSFHKTAVAEWVEKTHHQDIEKDRVFVSPEVRLFGLKKRESPADTTS